MAAHSITTQSILDGLDARAKDLERKWGVERLRLLVGDELRIRFDQQRRHLNDAPASGDAEQIALHAAAMRRGWDALDSAATEAGAEPLNPVVWECSLPNGEVVSIVRTEAEAHHVCREGETWTLAEIGRLIERLGKDTRQIKNLFPGATVAEIRNRPNPDEPFYDDTELAVADLEGR
jgi:hypothetical protein